MDSRGGVDFNQKASNQKYSRLKSDSEENSTLDNNESTKPNQDCALIFSLSEAPPTTLANFSELLVKNKLSSATNEAYVRHQDKLYYLNQRENRCVEQQIKKITRTSYPLKKTSAQLGAAKKAGLQESKSESKSFAISKEEYSLSRFDTELQVFAESGARILTPDEITKIANFTGYDPHLSDWQKKNGCDFLVLDQEPSQDLLASLPFTHAAYLRYKNQLWYANRKAKKSLILLKTVTPTSEGMKRGKEEFTNREMEILDRILGTIPNLHRHLNDSELAQIKALTGHAHQTPLTKTLNHFGLISSAIIAISSGVQSAGNFSALGLLAAGPTALIAAVLLLVGTAVNWWVFKRYVSPVLIDLFGREKFLVDEEGQPLTPAKKAAMGLAFFLSIAVGFTFAAFAYITTFALPLGFPFLAALGSGLQPIALILAAMTFICMIALTFKDIASLIKKKDIIAACRQFLHDLVSTDKNLPLNLGKSPAKIKFQIGLRIAMTIIFMPLACLGLFMTLNACAPGVKIFLLDKIPRMSVATADYLAKVISLGLAFIGQVPFGIATVLQTIVNFFKPKTQVKNIVNLDPEANKESILSQAWQEVKLASVAVNSLGNGGISLAGSPPSPLLQTLSFTSGAANSAFSGIPAVTSKDEFKMTPGPQISHLRQPQGHSVEVDTDSLEIKKPAPAPFSAKDTSLLMPLADIKLKQPPAAPQPGVSIPLSTLGESKGASSFFPAANKATDQKSENRTQKSALDDLPVRYRYMRQ